MHPKDQFASSDPHIKRPSSVVAIVDRNRDRTQIVVKIVVVVVAVTRHLSSPPY
jgi:hypothetical protein